MLPPTANNNTTTFQSSQPLAYLYHLKEKGKIYNLLFLLPMVKSSAYNSFQMSVDWTSRFKKTFKVKLVIAGLIFAVVGWFLLGVMLFGRFFEEELLEIEGFVQSTVFTWGLRILILGAVIVLIRKNKWLTKALQNKKIKVSLYIFYGVGFIGWLWGIIDLLA